MSNRLALADMKRIVAKRNAAGNWRIVSRAADAEATADDEFDEYAAEASMNKIVSKIVVGIGDPLWRIEYAKYVGVHLAGSLAGAIHIAQRMSAAEPHETEISIRTRKPREFRHALNMIATNRSARSKSVWTARAKIGMALPIAFMFLLQSVWQNRGASPTSRPRAETLLALHEEISTRTRTLLPPTYESGTNPLICLIGRPKGSIAQASAILDPERRMPDARYFRPLGWRAMVSALPAIIMLWARGLQAAAVCPAVLPFRECIGIAYRIGLGAVAARWWRSNGPLVDIVLFGHTGVADTIQLDLSMQQAGAQTVHCVHGVSLGWNFGAVSDIGLFVNGHDAELARDFPDYKATAWRPVDKPKFISGEPDKWLLLTAYSHPMNPAFAYEGVGPDLAAMRRVAQIAAMADRRPTQILWRPHPALRSLPRRLQDMLDHEARVLGLTPWPKDRPYDSMSVCGRIFSTPSTAALDALKLGKVADILVTAPLVRETVYSLWREPDPIRAPGMDEFNRLWQAIRPGRFICDVSELRNLKFSKAPVSGRMRSA